MPARTELEPSSLNDILIHAHTIDGRQAATLYVKNIPVLTFIGTEVSSLSNNSDVISLAASSDSLTLQTSTSSSASASSSLLDAENDPVSRATRLGKQLDSEGIDASEISVRWDEEREGYTVTLADQELIALDSRTILADTTDNEAEDALQVTNRLRRLIGGEEPVSEIEGLPAPEPAPPAPAQTVAISSSTVGGASWYGPGFHGRRSASGEVFNQNALTAAHKTLPFGTRVLVTNLNNGRQVTVRINDRGPYSGNRIIDLSAGAAAQIGLINSGVGTVRLDVLAN
ncbi:MAG: septal ring lytic transglycosylase RlpA family protein [Phormidesmis sp. RL_2_1]|nr:septal ring lytic transglycosylase RlpA family protein [Phormidesmis sp. RL_2_1]